MIIDFTQVIKNKEDYLSHDEVDRVLSHCLQTEDIDMWMLCYTLYHTGRRISEVLGQPRANYAYVPGLRPCDIKWDLKRIEWCILKKRHIKTKTKAGKEVSEERLRKERFHKKPYKILIPADSVLLSYLRKYIESKDILNDERIFPIHRSWYDAKLKRINKSISIKNLHAHIFRHTFAIHFLQKHNKNPLAMQVLMQILCHSSIIVTSTYAQFADEGTRGMIEDVFVGPEDALYDLGNMVEEVFDDV